MDVGWGFNLKAQSAGDGEPRCSCSYGRGRTWIDFSGSRTGSYQRGYCQRWVSVSPCSLPAGAKEPSGNPLQKRLENADSSKPSFPLSPGLLSVCWEKRLGSRMQFPIATWEICSAESPPAGRVLSQAPQRLWRCSCVAQEHSSQPSSCHFSVPMTSGLASPRQALVCAPFFSVLIKKHVEKYPSLSSCAMRKRCVCFFLWGECRLGLLPDWKAVSQVGLGKHCIICLGCLSSKEAES